VAYDKVRKKERAFDPELVAIEEKFKESLGTRVHIERRDNGGKLTIDFFSADDLRDILDRVTTSAEGDKMGVPADKMERFIEKSKDGTIKNPEVGSANASDAVAHAADDRTKEEIKESETIEIPGGDGDDLYSVKNFTV
jgi:hypothetical protein